MFILVTSPYSTCSTTAIQIMNATAKIVPHRINVVRLPIFELRLSER